MKIWAPDIVRRILSSGVKDEASRMIHKGKLQIKMREKLS